MSLNIKEFLVVAGVIAIGVLIALTGFSFTSKATPLKGVGEFATYSKVVPTTAACSTAGNTLIEATNTARTSFIVSNNSTNTIFICKSGTCAQNAGIVLTTTTGGNPTYEQLDSYTGTWSCAALGGTSTLSVQKSP